MPNRFLKLRQYKKLATTMEIWLNLDISFEKIGTFRITIFFKNPNDFIYHLKNSPDLEDQIINYSTKKENKNIFVG